MPDIHHRIPISAAADIVSGLVAGGPGFARWWAEDVTSEGEDRVSLGFFNRSTIYRLRRLKRDDAVVAWLCESGDEWHGTELQFAVSSGQEGVVLDFRHTGWRAETTYFTSCNTTWGELMFRLKSAAEGKPRGPLFQRGALAY